MKDHLQGSVLINNRPFPLDGSFDQFLNSWFNILLPHYKPTLQYIYSLSSPASVSTKFSSRLSFAGHQKFHAPFQTTHTPSRKLVMACAVIASPSRPLRMTSH